MSIVSNPNVFVVPTYVCLPMSKSWISQNMWIVAVIVFGSLLVLAWLTWLMCYRGTSRPVILQVVPECHA